MQTDTHVNEDGHTVQRIQISLPPGLYEKHKTAVDEASSVESVKSAVDQIVAAFERLKEDEELFRAAELLASGAVRIALTLQREHMENTGGDADDFAPERRMQRAAEVGHNTYSELVAVQLVLDALNGAGESVGVDKLGSTLKGQIWPLMAVKEALLHARVENVS